MRILWNSFWVIREREPSLYREIVLRKEKFQRYLQDRFGLNLIITRYFARIEKLPTRTEAWMGIKEFQNPRDFVFLACLLAFLEEKNVEEQFLLSGLCEGLTDLYPEPEFLDWTNYEHRKSLVRTLRKAVDFGILKVIEGEVEGFQEDEEREVLYEVTVLSRYFLPTFPRELKEYQGISDFVSMHKDLSRRKRIYRDLFLQPAVFLPETGGDLFEYLRRYRENLQEDIEKTSDFELEIYRDVAFLNLVQNPGAYVTYPNNSGVSDVALHVAWIIGEENFDWERDFLKLTSAEWEDVLEKARNIFGRGWSKEFRECRILTLSNKVLNYLQDWKMGEAVDNLIYIYPLFLRVCGLYPEDFAKKEEIK